MKLLGRATFVLDSRQNCEAKASQSNRATPGLTRLAPRLKGPFPRKRTAPSSSG